MNLYLPTYTQTQLFAYLHTTNEWTIDIAKGELVLKFQHMVSSLLDMFGPSPNDLWSYRASRQVIDW